MANETIVIIQYTASKADSDHGKEINRSDVQYLVKYEDDKYSFYSYEDRVIGTEFQRDLLIRKLKDDFNIEDPKLEIYLKVKIANSQLPKVVYILKLTRKQHESLQDISKDDGLYKWIDGNNLINKSISWISNQEWLFKSIEKTSPLLRLKPIDEELINQVRILKEASDSGNLVIFVGAGISKASGLPLWKEIIEELKDDLVTSVTDMEIIPQLYSIEHGVAAYNKKVQKLLNPESRKPNAIHQEIFRLTPCHLITTNYDDLLEMEASSKGLDYQVISTNEDLVNTQSNKYIIKMHGDFEHQNIVFAENDYLKYEDNFSLIENFVKSLFSNKIILFLGFSFRDSNLKRIIHSVKKVLKDNSLNSYIFYSSSEKSDRPNSMYMNSFGIEIIDYDPYIESYIEVMGLKNIPKLENEKEKSLVMFLKFVKEFNNYGQFVTKDGGILENTIEKLYESLVIYEDMVAVPIKQLVKLHPLALNSSNPASYNPIEFHLNTPTDSVIDVIDSIEEFKIQNKKVVFKESIPEIAAWSEKKKDELESKLFKALTILVKSSVQCLHHKNETRQPSHHQIKMQYGGLHCQCVACRFHHLEFGNLFDEKIINYDSDEIDDLLKGAYICFALGNFFESYRMLKEGIRLALQSHKYHIYFIFLTNLKYIEYRIGWDDLDPQEIEKIQEEIKDIKIVDILSSLRISETSKRILEDIYTNDFYNTAQFKIREIVNEIDKLYKAYENRPYHTYHGPMYGTKLIWTYKQYLNFVERNHLFFVFYGEHQNISSDFMYGILTSLASSPALTQKLKEIDYDTALSIIKYSSTEELFDVIKEKFRDRKSEIKFQDKEQGIFLQIINGFIESMIDKSQNVFKEPKIKDEFVSLMKSSLLGHQFVVGIFERMLLLFSIMGISQFQSSSDIGKQLKEFIGNTFQYIALTQFRPFYSDKYFRLFLKRISDCITEENYKVLIEASLSKFVISKDIIFEISGILSDKEGPVIKEEKLFVKMINKVLVRENFYLQFKDLLPYYPLLSEEYKLRFEKLIDPKIYSEDLEFKIEAVKYGFKKDEFIKELKEDFKLVDFGDEQCNDVFQFHLLYLKSILELTQKQKNQLINLQNLFTLMFLPNQFDSKYMTKHKKGL